MKKSFLLVCAAFLVQISYSQSRVVEFLKAGKEDANTLFNAYLNPYALALGDGLNNGWYNSAKTHSLFGFDLTLSVSAIQIPAQDKTFDLGSIKFNKLSLENPNNHIAPTIAGENVSGPRLLIKDNGTTIASFNSPNGSGLNTLPVPMIQVGYGLLPHTDIIGRYVPDIKYTNNGDVSKIGFWGVGVKHNFMEWIPVLKALPFDASVFGNYSSVNGQSDLSFNPSDYNQGNVTITLVSNSQMLKLKTNTTKFGLVVSKKFSVLTVFAGIGQSSSKTTIDLIGNYVIKTTVPIGATNITTSDELNDPVALQFKSSKISMDAGLRLKLAFFSLFGSINKSEYTSYNAGIALSVR